MEWYSFDDNVPVKYKNQIKLAVKDEYLFDFLELSDEHSEKELETSLISKINNFLLEMGDSFC
ncbi:MAG: PDDEXK nuclease domain-containing protein, partial [Planctomycetota bacterium]